MMDVFIVGYGDIGQRVARLELIKGRKVAAMQRNPDNQHVQNPDIQHYTGDLDAPESLVSLPLAGTALYYFAPPPNHGNTDPRMTTFLTAITAVQLPEKIVYISTTGVYGNRDGAWVDESSPPNPQTDRARRRLDAEQQLLSWGRSTGTPVVILRVPGIYGPGRLPIDAVQAARPVVRLSEANHTNRIHADDLAAVCVTAMQRGMAGEIYNVSDGQQSSMSEYFIAIAESLGLPRPPEISWADAQQQLSPALLSYLAESRRVSNHKMLSELGVTLRYPTLAQGLSDCIK